MDLYLSPRNAVASISQTSMSGVGNPLEISFLFPRESICGPKTTPAVVSFLILHDIVQAADTRKDLNNELISLVEVRLRFPPHPDTGWRSRDDDRPRQQSCSLRQETHKLWDAKDHVTTMLSVSLLCFSCVSRRVYSLQTTFLHDVSVH
jgi:hypothetical protein